MTESQCLVSGAALLVVIAIAVVAVVSVAMSGGRKSDGGGYWGEEYHERFKKMCERHPCGSTLNILGQDVTVTGLFGPLYPVPGSLCGVYRDDNGAIQQVELTQTQVETLTGTFRPYGDD